MSEHSARDRRIQRIKKRILGLGVPYLKVCRTSQHIYVQLHSADGKGTLASASSLEKGIKEQVLGSGKKGIAEAVGKLIAERAKARGIIKVAFDRNGYKYHGRVRSVADGARANGLDF